MIYTYGISTQGPYHIKNNIPCQDSHRIEVLENGWTIGAVADGIGSEAHSDLASFIAVNTAVEAVSRNLEESMEEEDVIKVVSAAFSLARRAVEESAGAFCYDISECGTTLSLAAVKDGDVYYGHIGDSGILIETTEGRFEPVTTQQRDELGRVFPLSFQDEYAVFGRFEKKAAAVLLCTDGIWDILFPVYLRDSENPVYNALAKALMDPFETGAVEGSFEETSKELIEYIEGLPKESVDDDKTVAVLVNTDVGIEYMPEEYYAEPDWEEIIGRWRENYRKQAYGDLFEE